MQRLDSLSLGGRRQVERQKRARIRFKPQKTPLRYCALKRSLAGVRGDLLG